MAMSDRQHSYRNLWALTVLCLLRERPMHPYELQRLIRERKKDDFLELKRGSLYHNIERLQSAGLIAAVETTREGRRPERTIYRLTTPGKEELITWLRELLAHPGRDSVPFVAAISFMGHLGQKDALNQLRNRSAHLGAEITQLDAALAELTPHLGRLLILETEYARAMRQAELEWVRSLIEDLQSRKLTWKPEAFFPRAEPTA
jgi:DNA-binding PadR family transcriptional regulator